MLVMFHFYAYTRLNGVRNSLNMLVIRSYWRVIKHAIKHVIKRVTSSSRARKYARHFRKGMFYGAIYAAKHVFQNMHNVYATMLRGIF